MPVRRADFPRATISTRFVRVPLQDWPRLKTGEKTELRGQGRHATHHHILRPPEPIVGYSFRRYRDEAESRLFVVTDARAEPLGAISPDSLRAEGFDTMAEFKAYWISRFKVYKPLNVVQVMGLRPWRDGVDDRELAEWLLDRLYGQWL